MRIKLMKLLSSAFFLTGMIMLYDVYVETNFHIVLESTGAFLFFLSALYSFNHKRKTKDQTAKSDSNVVSS
jgi:hypothetical protein